MAIRYRMLTTTQRKKIKGLPPTPEYGYALDNVTNQIISLHSMDITKRNQNCTTCTQNCAVGETVWTRDGYRNQGHLKNLHNFMLTTLGVDKVYAGGSNIPMDSVVINRKYGFLYAQGVSLGMGTADPADCLISAEAFVARISADLGFAP